MVIIKNNATMFISLTAKENMAQAKHSNHWRLVSHAAKNRGEAKNIPGRAQQEQQFLTKWYFI